MFAGKTDIVAKLLGKEIGSETPSIELIADGGDGSITVVSYPISNGEIYGIHSRVRIGNSSPEFDEYKKLLETTQ